MTPQAVVPPLQSLIGKGRPMPLLIVVRLLTSVLSLVVLGAAAYLGWTWYEGDTYSSVDGVLVRAREDWRLWVAVGLLLWSLMGRFVIGPLLGRADDAQSLLAPRRGEGEFVDTPTGATVYVERHGDSSKPMLLFTHGWGLDSTIWQYAKRDLLPEFHLVVWDLPGLGKSRRGPDGRTDPTRFAADLQAVMDFVGAKDIILVGHSIGGMTIQSLVRDAPEQVHRQVAGIVLLNTTYTNPINTAFGSAVFRVLRWPVLEPLLFMTRLLQPLAWLDAWRAYLNGSAHLANRIQFGGSVTRSQLNAVTLLGTRNPQGVLAHGNQGMFRWDATAAMRHYLGPVLVIGGRVDLATKVEASRVIAAEARGSRLLEVDGVNHCGFLENAAVYNDAIAEFARTVRANPVAETSALPRAAC
jgi:pimeloyl-ACP methyl ester carboxylesterase